MWGQWDPADDNARKGFPGSEGASIRKSHRLQVRGTLRLERLYKCVDVDILGGKVFSGSSYFNGHS